VFSKQLKIFTAGFCTAFCLVALFGVVQPKAASGDDDAILRELKGLREELAGFRKDFNELIDLTGIREVAQRKASAEVAQIIGELRNMKAASMMFYADSMDEINKGTVAISVAKLKPYVDNPNRYDSGIYIFETFNNKWWVGVNLEGKSSGVKIELKNRAQSTGLLGERNLKEPYTGQDIVWMIAR
jgi:hypothetical protein